MSRVFEVESDSDADPLTEPLPSPTRRGPRHAHPARAHTPPSDLPPGASLPLHQNPRMDSLLLHGEDGGDASDGFFGDAFAFPGALPAHNSHNSHGSLGGFNASANFGGSTAYVGSGAYGGLDAAAFEEEMELDPGAFSARRPSSYTIGGPSLSVQPPSAGPTPPLPAIPVSRRSPEVRRSPRAVSVDSRSDQDEYDPRMYPFYPPVVPRRREASPPMPLPASPPRPARTYATPYVIAPPGRPPRITGLAYDARMLAHRILDEEHDTHPENPERLRKVWETLRREGLADRCSRVKCRNATLDELRLFHTEEMIAHIVRTTEMSSYELRNFGNAFNSLYVNHESYASAMLSCGSVIEMCSRVARGELHNGVCVVRPPGHHAEAHEPMGFCVFNNVAVAANVLKAKHGLRRILILDWDVHHGNGTQNAFFNDPAVLYISIHRYDNMQFYPNSNDAAANAIGEGPGTGFNVNVPWEGGGGLGDADYIHAFQRVVMPIATEYNPELVIISAGFDAAMDDPLGGCRVTPFGYAHMTYMLSSLAGGRVVVALEGGYNARSVSLSMAAVTSVLLGDPVPSFDYGRVGVPCRKAYEVVEQVVRIQSRYWESMLPRHHMRVDRNKRDRTVYKAAAWSMQEVLSVYRHMLLTTALGFVHFRWDESSLSPHIRNRFHGDIHVFGDVASLPRAGGQRWEQPRARRHPIIFVHESPSVRAVLDPYENVLERGSSHLLDPTVSFLKALTTHVDPEDVLVFVVEADMDEMKRSGLERLDRMQLLDELLGGIWDELIEPNGDLLHPAVLIGVGNTCTSVVNLINQRPIEGRVAGVALAMGDSNPPAAIYGKEQWYYDHSRVVLAHSNPAGSKVRASPANGAVISAGEEDVTSEYVFSLFRVDLLNFVFHQAAGLGVRPGWELEFENMAKVQVKKSFSRWAPGRVARPAGSFMPPGTASAAEEAASEKGSARSEASFPHAPQPPPVREEEPLAVSEDELADLLQDAGEDAGVVPGRRRRAAADDAMRSMKEEAAPAGLAEEEEDESDDGEYQEGLAQVGLADAGEAASEPSEPDVQGGGDRGFEPGDAAAEEDDDDDDLLRDVEEEDLDGGIEDVDLPPEYADRFKKMQEMEKLDPVVSYEEGGGRRRRRTTASASAEDLPDAGGSDPISRVSSPKAAQPPKETTPAGGVASGSVSMSTTPPRMQTYDDLLFPSGQFSPHGGPAVHDGHLMQAPGSHLELPTAGMELDEFVVLGDDHDLHGHSGAGDGAWDELAD